MPTDLVVQKIFEILKNKGLTILFLSKKMDKPKQYFYDLRRRKNITLDELEEIAGAIDVEVEVILKIKIDER